MVTFRNNNRRPNFRRNDRNFKSNGDRSNFKSKFSTNSNFQRNVPGRNNHNASKLIEKYNEMAREALANEDRVLSENYFQHADHFTRVQNEQETLRKARVHTPAESVSLIKTDVEAIKTEVESIKEEVKTEETKKIISEPVIKKATKPSEKKPTEKKSVAV